MNCLHGESANQSASPAETLNASVSRHFPPSEPTSGTPAFVGSYGIAMKRIYAAQVEREDALIEALCLLLTTDQTNNSGPSNLFLMSSKSSCLLSPPE